MNTRAAGMAVVALSLIPATGATASEPRVTVSRHIRSIPLDAGYLVEVVCVARAHPGDPTQIPVVTTVSCAIDDYVQTQAVPGAVAVVTATSAVTGPFELCVSGEALFVDPVAGTSPSASRTKCQQVHP